MQSHGRIDVLDAPAQVAHAAAHLWLFTGNQRLIKTIHRFQRGAANENVSSEEERLARSVGRPSKPESAKAKRVMISMTPSLIKAAGTYAKRTGRTLSGLIAESLVEKIKSKAS